MSCNCNNILRITSATTSTSAVTLTPSETPTLSNKKKFKMIIQTNDGVTSTEPVYIAVGTTSIPLVSSYSGNMIYSNELETRRVYNLVYGIDNAFMTDGQFVVRDNIYIRG